MAPSLTSTLGLDSFALDPLAGRSRFKSLSESSPMTAHPRGKRTLQPKRLDGQGDCEEASRDVKPQLSSDALMVFDVFWWFLIAMFIMFGIHTMNIFKKNHQQIAPAPRAFGNFSLEVSTKCPATWQLIKPWGGAAQCWKPNQRVAVERKNAWCLKPIFFCEPIPEIWWMYMNMLNSAKCMPKLGDVEANAKSQSQELQHLQQPATCPEHVPRHLCCSMRTWAGQHE